MKLYTFAPAANALRVEMFLREKELKLETTKKKIILFSPAAASFDQFNNFEERGKYFNSLIKKIIYV